MWKMARILSASIVFSLAATPVLADADARIKDAIAKLLPDSKIDSIEVGPDQVEMQMEARLDYFMAQFGSEEEMENYFNQSIFDIKDDLRASIHEQMVTGQVASSITENVSTTPSDVKSFYRSLHPDSIPYINTSVELAQIVAYPSFSEEAVFEVKERLLDLRQPGDLSPLP